MFLSFRCSDEYYLVKKGVKQMKAYNFNEIRNVSTSFITLPVFIMLKNKGFLRNFWSKKNVKLPRFTRRIHDLGNLIGNLKIIQKWVRYSC